MKNKTTTYKSSYGNTYVDRCMATEEAYWMRAFAAFIVIVVCLFIGAKAYFALNGIAEQNQAQTTQMLEAINQLNGERNEENSIAEAPEMASASFIGGIDEILGSTK